MQSPRNRWSKTQARLLEAKRIIESLHAPVKTVPVDVDTERLLTKIGGNNGVRSGGTVSR